MSNKVTKQSGLVLNVNKTKRRIYQYYDAFMPDHKIGEKKEEKKEVKKEAKTTSKKKSKSKKSKSDPDATFKNKPLFRGGATTYVFLTSIVEQLIVYVISNSCKDVPVNSDSDMKEITRNKIINTIKGNNVLDIIFYEAIKYYDSGINYSENSIMSNRDLEKILDKYLENDIGLTPQAVIFIKYITDFSFDTCIKILSIIKQNSPAKSIVLQQVTDCVRLFMSKETLFKKFRVNADKCADKVKKITKDDDSDSDSEKEEEEEDDDDDDDDNSSDDDDDKKKKKSKSKK
jgi:hypothetical protein